MTDQTHRRIQTLARGHCAAFIGKDSCRYEPNGQPRCQFFRDDPQALPFIESGDIRCFEFETSVLVRDPALWARYWNRDINAIRCVRCGKSIVRTSNATKYCVDCRDIRRKQAEADRQRRRYWAGKSSRN